MDHPCHKCHQPVEDGVPFCSQCGAPQIRVQVPEPVPQEPGTAANPVSLRGPSQSLWTNALQPCALAALLASVAVSFGLTFPAAAIGGGVLAVTFYRRRNPLALIKARTGAALGAISGIFCFVISGTYIGLMSAFTDVGPKLRAELLEGLQKAAATRAGDPQVQAMVDSFKSPEGFAAVIIFTVVVFFVCSILFSSLGGAIGGALLNRRR